MACGHQTVPPSTAPAEAPAATVSPEVPAATIGVATLEADGTLVLQLRAEGGGALGDALLRYPKDHPKYQEILAHVGPIQPGESKPVLHFP